MKANGRRRWRKAARKLRRDRARRWRDPENWTTAPWKQIVGDAHYSVMKRETRGSVFRRRGDVQVTNGVTMYIGLRGNFSGEVPCLSADAKPFTALSLVGMTQGARKRAARIRCAWAVLQNGSNGAAEVLRITRAKYRIGERLRPCPGKHGCRNCTRTCGACEDQCPDDTQCKRCGSVMTTGGPFCDGSGLLRARKARR